MSFRPVMREGGVELMDARIFADVPMRLRDDLLVVPVAQRLDYDPSSNLFFVNFEGHSVRTPADVETIRAAVEDRLAQLAHKVYAVVNYDRFSIDPLVIDEYVEMVKGLMDRHYHDVTRYASSAFLRLRLDDALARRNVDPHVFSTASEARAHLAR
jgi:propionate CoA-transferase